ncbi:MAG: hypothetical protein JO270_06030 [Acidobacteriaceae bacterium]|nr:hypothetical protein [Acidobacteriaceae bacterium]MBV8572689.1 hypothetical protein [Acidobacteriaceae bacterium]
MKTFEICLSAVLFAAALSAPAQQQSAPGQTSTYQQKNDVPHQSPGTQNPDVASQRSTSAPPAGNSDSSSTVKHRKKSHPRKSGTTETTATGH